MKNNQTSPADDVEPVVVETRLLPASEWKDRDEPPVYKGPPPKRLTEYSVRIHDQYVQLQTAPLPITSV